MALLRPEDPIRVLASTPVTSVDPDMPLEELTNVLDADGVGAVVVVQGGRVDGVVSERDVVRAIATRVDPSRVPTADFMSIVPSTIDGDEPIVTAAERMVSEGIRHLPVTIDGSVQGIVSMRDVLGVLIDDWRHRRHECRPPVEP